MASVSGHCSHNSSSIQPKESHQTTQDDTTFNTPVETGWQRGASKILLWFEATYRAYQSGSAPIQSKNAANGCTPLYEHALRVIRDLRPLHGIPNSGKMAALAFGLWICRLSLISMAFRVIWYLLGFIFQGILIGCVAYFILPRFMHN
jgi:hypothetical protein